MKAVNGDLIEMAKMGVFDVIVHGCNCFNTMGAGIAKQIKRVYFGAYMEDQKTVKGDKSKLGTIGVFDDTEVKVVNAYTQFKYWGDTPADYDAIRSCFKEIGKEFGDLRIGYPKIGAGLAGGDWDIISKIIDEELAGCNHTVVIFKA